MADDVTQFRSRADAEFANARAATLDNVRERCERAGRAWAEMADRAQRTATQRHAREQAAEKARHDAAAALEPQAAE